MNETRQKLNCSGKTVYRLYKAGKLRGFKLNDTSKAGIRIFAESVQELMERNANPEPVKVEPALLGETKAKKKTRPGARVEAWDKYWKINY